MGLRVTPRFARDVCDSLQVAGRRGIAREKRLGRRKSSSRRLRHLLRSEKVQKVVGVLLLHCQDLLHEHSGGGVGIAEPTDDLRVYLDGDSFGDQVFLQHLHERSAAVVVRMRSLGQPLGSKVGMAIQLRDARSYAFSMFLLFVCVLSKLLGYGFCRQPRGSIEVRAISQDANKLGGQRVIEYLDYSSAISTVGISHGTGLEVGTCSLLYGSDVDHEVVHIIDIPKPCRFKPTCNWIATVEV